MMPCSWEGNRRFCIALTGHSVVYSSTSSRPKEVRCVPRLHSSWGMEHFTLTLPWLQVQRAMATTGARGRVPVTSTPTTSSSSSSSSSTSSTASPGTPSRRDGVAAGPPATIHTPPPPPPTPRAGWAPAVSHPHRQRLTTASINGHLPMRCSPTR